MKTTFPLISKLTCIMALGALLLAACSDDDNSQSATAVEKPLLAVTAEDGSSVSHATIDEANHTIWIPFEYTKNLTDIYVTFKLARGTRIVQPSNTTAILNLKENNPYEVVINNGVEDVTYLMTAAEPVDNIFQSVAVQDGSESNQGLVDESTHTIYFQFVNETSLTNAHVSFNLTEGARMVTPAENNTTLDLSHDQAVTIFNGIKNVTYTLRAAHADEGLCLHDPNLTDVTADYGNPSWLKAFYTTTLFGKKDFVGSLIMMKQKDVKMTILGSGFNAKHQPEGSSRLKTVARANPEWPFMMPVLGLDWEHVNLLMVKQAGSVFSRPDQQWPTLGYTTDGRVEIKYVDNKDIEGDVVNASDDPTTIGDRKVSRWDVMAAVSAYTVPVHKGQLYADLDAVSLYEGLDQRSGTKGTNARSCIGLTRNGLVYALFAEGSPYSPGVTVMQMAEYLYYLGCTEVLVTSYGQQAVATLYTQLNIRSTDFKTDSDTGSRCPAFIAFGPK